ncbi:hypothetical protein VTI28DRAFT_6155 [Corynascus sepedonium]
MPNTGKVNMRGRKSGPTIHVPASSARQRDERSCERQDCDVLPGCGFWLAGIKLVPPCCPACEPCMSLKLESGGGWNPCLPCGGPDARLGKRKLGAMRLQSEVCWEEGGEEKRARARARAPSFRLPVSNIKNQPSRFGCWAFAKIDHPGVTVVCGAPVGCTQRS